MSTVEELFKAATQAMEEKVFTPTVLAKLAERGYKATNQEELNELLKHANLVREGVANGEIVPVPAAHLTEKGELSKEASEKVAGDFLAFAPEVKINIAEVEPVIKEAAAILTWGFLKAEKDSAAAEQAKK